jgi:hypothetical protein
MDFLNQTYICVIITSISYITHIFQVPDLTLFDVFKRRKQYHLPLDEDITTTEFLIRTDHGLKQTMVDFNISNAFQAFEFQFATTQKQRSDGFLFDEEKLKESQEFKELWSLDFPPENLSRRRRDVNFE